MRLRRIWLRNKLLELIKYEVNNLEMRLQGDFKYHLQDKIINKLHFDFHVSEENYDGTIIIEPSMTFDGILLNNVNGKLKISLEVEVDESKKLTHHKLKVEKIS